MRRSARLQAADSLLDSEAKGSGDSATASHPEAVSNKSNRGKQTSSVANEVPTGLLQADSALSASVKSDTEARKSGESKPRTKRKKPSEVTQNLDKDAMDFVMTSATAEDRQNWKGWCEVESEPAFFNVMLREFGVEAIKVQEVVSLDEEMLAFLPKPVYGLVFLFQFKDDDPTKQEATCPEHVWFANQTTSNACASIALLNIVMNIPDIELGPTLDSLKSFTSAMNPATRGYQVCNHDYIRQIHNSFARKMDMLNADLALSNDASAKKWSKKAKSKKDEKAVETLAGFHYVAFVPINGSVWKLDGLERQPMNLGSYDEDWMKVARPILEGRMQQYEGEEIQFNLLSLCRNPLLTILEDLACNIHALKAVESQLQIVRSDWKEFIEDTGPSSTLRGPSAVCNLTQGHLDRAELSSMLLEKLADPAITAENLLIVRQELIAAQTGFRAALVEEIANVEQDNVRATGRRHDYTPMVYYWIQALAENGTLQSLVEAATKT